MKSNLIRFSAGWPLPPSMSQGKGGAHSFETTITQHRQRTEITGGGRQARDVIGG